MSYFFIISGTLIFQKNSPNKLIKKEEAASGRVATGIYMLYLNAMGVFKFVFPYFFAVVLYMAFAMGRSLWLSGWSDSNIDPTHPDNMSVGARLGVYAVFGVTEGLHCVLSIGNLRIVF